MAHFGNILKFALGYELWAFDQKMYLSPIQLTDPGSDTMNHEPLTMN